MMMCTSRAPPPRRAARPTGRRSSPRPRTRGQLVRLVAVEEDLAEHDQPGPGVRRGRDRLGAPARDSPGGGRSRLGSDLGAELADPDRRALSSQPPFCRGGLGRRRGRRTRSRSSGAVRRARPRARRARFAARSSDRRARPRGSRSARRAGCAPASAAPQRSKTRSIMFGASPSEGSSSTSSCGAARARARSRAAAARRRRACRSGAVVGAQHREALEHALEVLAHLGAVRAASRRCRFSSTDSLRRSAGPRARARCRAARSARATARPGARRGTRSSRRPADDAR